jgi:Stage II sporulation protein E (SpoIIE)
MIAYRPVRRRDAGFRNRSLGICKRSGFTTHAPGGSRVRGTRAGFRNSSSIPRSPPDRAALRTTRSPTRPIRRQSVRSWTSPAAYRCDPRRYSGHGRSGWFPAQRRLIRTLIQRFGRWFRPALARLPLRRINFGAWIAEIVNSCASDPRVGDSERTLKALICAPLRAGQRTVGNYRLGQRGGRRCYSAADLKLLNTIALQTAAAIANSILCAEMVDAAQARAAFAAELHAASTVQQLLLQSASRPTPGFQVESVYLPASEVGGDFFFVSSATDGSVIAIVGDVSGKGLTAAMRVAMILGALRRESSHDPGEILFGLNNALIAEGQLGSTTACCIRISLSGEYTLSNAGHIAPYRSGRELETPAALPLGLVRDQTYDQTRGQLTSGERLVLLSDGVPEARSHAGELYGFERLSSLTLMAAREIAEAAQRFGQEDDITVLTLAFTANLPRTVLPTDGLDIAL